MKKVEGNITNERGDVLGGAQIAVRLQNATPGSGSLATIYSDNGVTTTSNPLTADSNGKYSFYVVDGRYDLVTTATNHTQRIIADTEISDVLDRFSGDTAWEIDTATIGNLNNIRYVDGVKFTGADLGAAINAAAADAGTGAIVVVPPNPFSSTVSTALSLPIGTRLILPTGVIRFNVGSTISNANVSIEGAGDGGQTEMHLGTATLTLFTITGANFRFRNAFVGPSASITRTAGAVLDIQAQGGTVENINLQDPYRGFYFSNGSGDSWSFNNIRIQSNGGNWNSLFLTTALAAGTITSVNIHNIIGGIASAAAISAPLILLDSGVDGWSFVNIEAGMGGSVTNTQAVVKLQDTGAAAAPSWVRFTNFFGEAGTAGNAVEIYAGRDVSFASSYFTSSLRGFYLNAGIGVRLHDCIFLNNQRQGMLVDGGSAWSVTGSQFSDNSAVTNGLYDHLDVAAAVSDFDVSGNYLGNHILGNANKAAIGIAILAGASNNYTILRNTGASGAFTSTFISDSGTGTAKAVFGNQPSIASTLGFSTLAVKRMAASTGTALVAGDFALSGGWGAGSAVSAVTGTDAAWQMTVTAAGVPGANPTVTLTFKDGTWTNAPICQSKYTGGTGAAAFVQDAPTATTNVITFLALPVAASTYIFSGFTIGR